ncbi:hypothetical protein ES705_15595 [subsurface metagenome]|uniref:Uncharacterized protein n=1 Tax=marine sediment metagenome TaxID=412755 RepID=X1HCX2_9ZZZZ
MTNNEDEEDYHGVAPIKPIIKKMKKEYDKDPNDWRVIGSRDDQGNTDTFITKKPNAYWLKSKMLSPYSSLTMGTIVRNIDRDIEEEVRKGKTLSPNEMFRLFGMVVPIKKDQNIVAAGIEKYSQQHGNYLKEIIGERDSNLEYQMAKRIDEEFTKKHPQRKNLYI